MFGRLKLLAGLKGPTKQELALLDENAKLRDQLEGAALELQMTVDLLEDAVAITNRYANTLSQVRDTVAAVGSPNGTTRKIGRIVEQGILDGTARPLGHLAEQAIGG